MPLVKCGYCRERIRPQQKALHEKHCIEARRIHKRELSSTVDIPVIGETVDVPLIPEIPEKKKRGRPKKK